MAREVKKSLLEYCNELTEQGDPRGKQLLNEFGQIYGERKYTDENGVVHTPDDFSKTSYKKVIWTCEKGHQWETTIAHRSYSDAECPYCAGKKAIQGETDLATTHPDLLKEWDYELNSQVGIFPEQLKAGSHKKVHWKCAKGHQWTATVLNRTYSMSKCPHCDSSSTSFPEQFIYWSFKQILPDTQNRVILFQSDEYTRGFEYDIYVPDINLLIEYSGNIWHDEKEERDNLKRELAITNGYNMIVVEENPSLTEWFSTDEITITKGNHETLIQVVNYILYQFSIVKEIDFTTVERQAREYSKGKVEYEKSLAYLYPDIAKEWDYEANNGLTPLDVTIGSNYKAFWICSKDKSHKWRASISHRCISNSGCPYCTRQKTIQGKTDLASTHPSLSKEWDYELNDRTPQEVSAGSNYKAHWVCSENIKHRWVAMVYDRAKRGGGCPYCSNKAVLKGYNDIQTTHTYLAKEWDYELNEKTPEEVSAGSSYRAHWICSKNPNHKWRNTVRNRATGQGCPHCYNERRGKKKSTQQIDW